MVLFLKMLHGTITYLKMKYNGFFNNSTFQ